MQREKFLTVHNADWLAWSERHGIDPMTTECKICRGQLTTNIPIVTNDLRGLKAPQCECGNDDTPFCFVKHFDLGELFMDLVTENSKKPVYLKSSRPMRLVK